MAQARNNKRNRSSGAVAIALWTECVGALDMAAPYPLCAALGDCGAWDEISAGGHTGKYRELTKNLPSSQQMETGFR